MNNYMWLLIVFALCGGGYYEYTNLQIQAAAGQQVIKLELQGKIDQLETDKKALEESNQKLNMALEEGKTQMAFLSAQADAAQKALEVATKNPTGTSLSASVVAPNSGIGGLSTPTASASMANKLGTISTLDGKSYPESELLKVDANGITIKCASGITKVGFLLMPPELQKRFGFDPRNGDTLSEAQIERNEALRRAAAGN